MTKSEDYRLYLEEKFKSASDDLKSQTTLINAQFSNVNDRLDSIEIQVKKTNSRVTCLEDSSEDRQKVVDEFHDFKNDIHWFKRKWYFVLLGAILFVVVINYLTNIGVIQDVIKFLFNKI